MNDLFERLEDLPEPPLRPSADVLAAARRSSRRRNIRRAAAGLLGAFALIPGGALAIDELRPPPVAPYQAAAPAVTSQAPVPKAPTAGQVDKHAMQTARALIGAVPSGYQAGPVKLNGDWYAPASAYEVKSFIRKGGYRSVTLVRVSDGRGSGAIASVVGTDLPVPSADADLCAANQDLGIEGARIDKCETVTIDGTRVRVVTGTDRQTGRVMSALRYLRDGYIAVTASQGMRAYKVTEGSTPEDAWTWEVAPNPLHEKALGTMPFAAGDLATLAASPELLP